MSRKVINCFFIAVLIGIVFVTAAILTSEPENILINNENIFYYNDGWSYSVNDADGGALGALPQKIPSANKNDRVTIRNTLPSSYVQGMTLCFRSVQQYVRVFVGGEEIYEYGYKSKRLFGKSPGSAWNFVRLDTSTAGGEIAIEFVSPYSDYSKQVNEVHYGSKNANVFSIISNNIVGISISILLIIIGLLLLVFFWFLRKYGKSEPLLYLGLFAICAGLWSTMETRMLQFSFNNQANIVLFAFLTMMLMPVPLLIFIVETHSIHNKKPFYLLAFLILINFVVSALLQAFNVVDFIEFPLVTHGLIIAAIALIVVSIMVEIFKYKNKDIYILGIGSCVLVVISLLDFPQFYNKLSGDNSFFFRFGVLFYILILSFYTVKQLINMMLENMQTKALEELAYLDLLTKLHNRTAFEVEMEGYRSGAFDCGGLSIAVFDVNDLKRTNDTYGHKAGDDLIVQSGECLRRIFGEVGGVYRIGGDEFAVVVKNVDSQRFMRLLEAFDNEVAWANDSGQTRLSMAYGFAEYDSESDNNADALYVRADSNMYEKKAMMKGMVGRRRSDRESLLTNDQH